MPPDTPLRYACDSSGLRAAPPPPPSCQYPPPPPPPTPPPQVLTDSWGGCRIRTSCSCPPRVTHINSPVKYGGLGLPPIYWAYRTRYATLVQGLLRKPTGRLSKLVAQPIEHMMTPLRDYVTFLSQIGGNTTLVLAPRKRPPTSANLIDEQTSGDEEWITQQEVAVGLPEVARRYIPRCSANDDPTDGEVPPGFTPVEVAGIKYYTNGK